MNLRDRCHAFLIDPARLGRSLDDIIDDLVAFVVAEIGRMSDATVDPKLPLCIYFNSVREREQFIATVMSVTSGAKMKRVP